MSEAEPTLAWAWWVVRDDGDRCAGPFDSRDEAERKLRRVFDTSEYRVDYQYVPDQPNPTESVDRYEAAAMDAEGYTPPLDVTDGPYDKDPRS